jgi:DNA-binding CsgD family transcriptional regulator
LGAESEKELRSRRRYRPTVEALEALRMLSSAAHAHALSQVAAEHQLRVEPDHHAAPLTDDPVSVSSATWDAALVQTQLDEIFGAPDVPAADTAGATTFRTITPPATATGSDSATLVSGLTQLDRYLSRAWYRAGIPSQTHDDSSQGVYTALLQSLGRQRFDILVSEVGRWGVKDVFSRETSDGLAFFRAVDMVKKRVQRERSHQSLDSVDVPSASRDQRTHATWRADLQEAIAQVLSPREAALICDSLKGKTPTEIADEWGIAPKTVSNEKARILQKLRDVLAQHELN